MLIPMPQTREEWLALRGKYVGASEVAALFGCEAAYGLSRFSLHHIKRGTAPPPEVSGPRVKWGTLLEEVVALAAGEDHNWTVQKGRYAICDDTPGMAASLDFEVVQDSTGKYEGPGVLETKNVDWIVHKRTWTDGEPPLHILLQLQHQLACTGFSWGAVASLVGGNDLRVYPYLAKPKLIAQIKAKVREFWQEIADEREPPVTGSDADAAVLRALYQEVYDEPADLTDNNELPGVCARYLDAATRRRDAQKAENLAKNELMLLLGGHKYAVTQGFRISVAVTPEKAATVITPEMVGNEIPGRAEARRYTVKEMAA